MYTNNLLNTITPNVNNFKRKLLNPAKKSIMRILGVSAPIIACSTAIKSTAPARTFDTYNGSEFKYNENYIYNHDEWQKHTFAYIRAKKDKDIYEACIKGKSKQQQKHNLELIKKLKEALSEEELYESHFDPLNLYLKPGILTDENGIIDETRAINFIKEVERRKKILKFVNVHGLAEQLNM